MTGREKEAYPVRVATSIIVCGLYFVETYHNASM